MFIFAPPMTKILGSERLATNLRYPPLGLGRSWRTRYRAHRDLNCAWAADNPCDAALSQWEARYRIWLSQDDGEELRTRRHPTISHPPGSLHCNHSPPVGPIALLAVASWLRMTWFQASALPGLFCSTSVSRHASRSRCGQLWSLWEMNDGSLARLLQPLYHVGVS